MAERWRERIIIKHPIADDDGYLRMIKYVSKHLVHSGSNYSAIKNKNNFKKQCLFLKLESSNFTTFQANLVKLCSLNAKISVLADLWH